MYKPHRTHSAMMEFKKQPDRPPISNRNDDPHPSRFDLEQNQIEPPISGKVRKPTQFEMSKKLKRDPLWNENDFAPDYEPNPHFIKPRIAKGLPHMKKVPARITNDVPQMVKAPTNPMPHKVTKAFKTTTNASKPNLDMSVHTPRDDLMYRVIEGYKLNVPVRLMADEAPRNTTAPAHVKRFSLGNKSMDF